MCMKKTAWLCLVILIVLPVIVYPTACGSPASNTSTYINKEYGFSCEYPDGWTLDESIPNVVIAFTGPYISDIGRAITIMVTAEKSAMFSELTVEEYKQRADTMLSEQLDNYQKLGEQVIDVDSVPVIIGQFSHNVEGAMTKASHAFIKYVDTIYLVGISAEPEYHDGYYYIFDALVKSMEFE